MTRIAVVVPALAARRATRKLAKIRDRGKRAKLPKGTVIQSDEVVNLLGSCQACHAGAGKARDFVCGASLMCAPIAFDPATILALQNADPRCQPAE